MLLVRDYSTQHNYRTLDISENLFHKALSCVLKGETHFHVKNKNGPSFDLEYVNNQKWCESFPEYPYSPLFRREPLYPPYYMYDENDKDKICFDILDGIERIWFEEVNEYTVVITGIVLRYTDIAVLWNDKRIKWFYPKEEKIQITYEAPEDEKTLRVHRAFKPSAFDCDFLNMDQVVLFHHFFVYQWLTDLPLDKVKYAEILVAKSEGIGSILTCYTRTRNFLSRFGLEVTLQAGSSRYPDHVIEKYFTIKMTPEDSNEDNTIYITNYYGILFTKMLRLAHEREFGLELMNPGFIDEMKEYSDAIMKGKRMLGVLLRGSDYITSEMSGTSAPAAVESAVPKIREWMDEYGYDGIILATEDADILSKMKAAFPGKIRVVSQVRYSITDFERENVITISELDSIKYSGTDYDVFLEDSLVNYFYALYMISMCESFMYSGESGGMAMAKALNGGKYKKMYSFAEGKEVDE
jgi:hypothetical protein